jgi:hypothetical protein
VFVFLYFILFYISRQIALTGYFCFVYMDNDNNIAFMVHDSHRATFGNCNSINPLKLLERHLFLLGHFVAVL